MDGDERDAIILSIGYGKSETGDLVYHFGPLLQDGGERRLNVAITRARTKTIVCLPRPLLEASPQVLDVETAAAGLGFMRRLVEWVRQNGEELLFEGEDVEARRSFIQRNAKDVRFLDI